MTKIYLVPVRRVATDYAYIYAEDEQNAQEIAQELADAFMLETTPTMDAWEEQDAQDAEEDEDGDEAQAEENRQKYLELTETEEA